MFSHFIKREFYTPILRVQLECARLACEEDLKHAKESVTREHLKEILDLIEFLEKRNKKNKKGKRPNFNPDFYEKIAPFVGKGYMLKISKKHHHK